MIWRNHQLRRQADSVVLIQNDLYYSIQLALDTGPKGIVIDRRLVLIAYTHYKRKLGYYKLFESAAGRQSLQTTRQFIQRLLRDTQ